MITRQDQEIFRKSPSQKRARDTVDAILKATAHILIEDGFESVSTNRVAELAGVSIGSLYQYFPNKAALVNELMSTHLRSMYDLLASEVARARELSGSGLLENIVRAVIGAYRLKPRLLKALLEKVPRSGLYPGIQEHDQRMLALISQTLEARAHEFRLSNTGIEAFVVLNCTAAVVHKAILRRHDMLDEDSLREELTLLLSRYLLLPEN